MDGNKAAAAAAYALTETSIIYPISPSSTMGEMIDVWSTQGKKNIWNKKIDVTLMQSEAGVSGAFHGALQGGSLISTFSSSQGLMLMIPNLFKIAAALLPGVIHVASRASIQQIGSLYSAHDVIYTIRPTGWNIFSSGNPQEAHDMALISHLTSIKSSTASLHFFDGYRTSHTIQKVNVLDNSEISSLVDPRDIERFRKTASNPERPVARGTPVGHTEYFQWMQGPKKEILKIPDVANEVMAQFEQLTGRQYKPFKYFGHPEAEEVCVIMASGSKTVQEAVGYLNGRGKKVGVIQVHLYQPFSHKYLFNVMPKTTKRIVVMDRSNFINSENNPLFQDVVTAVHENRPYIKVIDGCYGEAGKIFTPGMALAAFENLGISDPKRHFTVGIKDDLLHSNLTVTEEPDLVPKGTKECLFWGLGSDGTIGANKEAISMISESTDQYAQGYFLYDAKKSGGLTYSHLRFGPSPITSEYEIKSADYFGCHNQSFLEKYPKMIDHIKQNGIFVINAPFKDAQTLGKIMTNYMKNQIAQKNIRVYVIDASKIAQESGLRGRINMIMQAVFFKLAKVIPVEKALTLLEKSIRKNYGKQGEKVINSNITGLNRAIDNFIEIKYSRSEWSSLEYDLNDIEKNAFFDENAPDFVKEVIYPAMKKKGSQLPSSAFPSNGQVPMGTSKYEKRGVAEFIPIWNPDKCTQCNICSFVCPHASIRPFVGTTEEIQAIGEVPQSFRTLKSNTPEFEKLDYNFRIQVSPYDCMGCSNCAKECRDGALEMVPAKIKLKEKEHKNWKFAKELGYRGDLLKNATTVRGSQFKQPLLEFSGACGGCGETTYVKLLTQLFGERMMIANASGCSIVWSSHFPSYAYTTNDKGKGPTWTNSLFEDNAEFGFGMAYALQNRRKSLATTVERIINELGSKLDEEQMSSLKFWLANKSNGKKSLEASERIQKWLKKTDKYYSDLGEHKLMKTLINDSEILTKPSIWMIGGDGWAYDIGYGGLDHVLAQELDVNVLVLDNQFYANTGFQVSKATPTGASAKFAKAGKPGKQKDLGAIAMTYEHIYVASVSMGANKNQLLKSLKDAESYDGPSLIIAYCPCIGHGIKTGTQDTQAVERRAVELGFWPLYRFDPRNIEKNKNPFSLDYKKVKGDIMKFLLNEVRFASLYKSFPKEAKIMHKTLIKNLKKKYRYFQGLEKNPQFKKKKSIL
ncbi:pyruvate-flavodoxin oxidoreductase-related [Anaeramoeba flamelloides]|uniref:Pyruvate-flavodoxin oxidoreductase-related n=1 Tax=Anaeramoeba flamelloides TaxID=1746091 RepID=A0ABQ8ZCW3_9EUKA|nr:pyruvate-flavodoxin oxidoreductase-related [Anaeramoeba flamelloides]